MLGGQPGKGRGEEGQVGQMRGAKMGQVKNFFVSGNPEIRLFFVDQAENGCSKSGGFELRRWGAHKAVAETGGSGSGMGQGVRGYDSESLGGQCLHPSESW